MADYRSNSYSFANNNGNMQIEPYNYGYGPNSNSIRPNDFRSYRVSSYASAAAVAQPQNLKKGKSSGSGGGSTSSKYWSFKDPEFQRKRRVAGYKVYSMKGKVKGPFRKSFRWLRDKYTRVLYGWW